MGLTRDNVIIQGVGAGVDYINQMRVDQLANNLLIQDINLEGALNELNQAREFIGSPEHILGQMSTKHGEIAEVFDVRFGNAARIIRGEDPIYSFEGVGRTAAEDYLRNNLPIQSKFVQSNLSIDAVIKHLDKYPDFVNGGGSYCIPKDYYEQIQKWMDLSKDELNKLPISDGGKMARNIVEKIHDLENETGKSFNELISPSELNYDQVQLNRAGDTLNQKEVEILEVDGAKREEYWKMSQATIEEGLKTAGIAAAISGIISFSTMLITIMKSQDKKISELNKKDWQVIFKETGIGAVKGGVSGGSIYALTNVAGMSAPLAAAFVSATLGVATHAIKLCKKEISLDDFMYNIVDIAIGAATSGVGAAIGQTIIPIPGVGAIVGSIVANKVLNIVKKHIFGGGFYELVKEAHCEKEYSDAYRPLVYAFEKSVSEWKYYEQDIVRRLRPYISRSEKIFEQNIGDLHGYIEGI